MMNTTRRSFFGVIAGAVAAVFGWRPARRRDPVNNLEDFVEGELGMSLSPWQKRAADRFDAEMYGRFMRTVAEVQGDGRTLLRTQEADYSDGPWIDVAHSYVPPRAWRAIKVQPWPAPELRER